MKNKICVFSVYCLVSAFLNIYLPVYAVEDYLTAGNKFYQSYIKTQNKQDLENAYLNYYKASQTNPSVSSFLGMGIVFIEKNMNSRAKEYLYKAYSIDKNDAATNYYLGILSYNNEEYVKALDYFKISYDLGLAYNYHLNLIMATIYEKVGDFELAKEYYIQAKSLNTEDNTYLQNKLLSLDEIKANIVKYFDDLD